MTTNEKIGITSTLKNIQEIERRLNGIKVDHDFYSNGFPFVAVEKQSANHLFGNGKWKKTSINGLGEDVFQKHCEKYGNRPIDIKIIKLKTEQAKYFAPNEEVIIKDNTGLYSQSTRVVDIDADAIIVMCPYKGNSTGSIINVSRRDGAKKSIKKHEQMLSDLKPGVYNEKKFSNAVPDNLDVATFSTPLMPNKPKKEYPKLTTKQIMIGALILSTIIGIALYYDYKSKTK